MHSHLARLRRSAVVLLATGALAGGSVAGGGLVGASGAAAAPAPAPARPPAKAAAQLSITPEQTALPPVRADLSRSVVLTVTNVGGRRAEPLVVSSTIGGPIWRIDTSRCADRRLRPGRACRIDVVFSTAGKYWAGYDDTATITATAGPTTDSATVQGTSLAAAFRVSPYSPMTVTAVGEPRTLTVTNVGDGSTGPLLLYPDWDEARWDVKNDSCAKAGELVPGASCSFTVIYRGPADTSSTLSYGFASAASQRNLGVSVSYVAG